MYHIKLSNIFWSCPSPNPSFSPQIPSYDKVRLVIITPNNRKIVNLNDTNVSHILKVSKPTFVQFKIQALNVNRCWSSYQTIARGILAANHLLYQYPSQRKIYLGSEGTLHVTVKALNFGWTNDKIYQHPDPIDRQPNNFFHLSLFLP